MAINADFRDVTVNLNTALPTSVILGKMPNYTTVSVSNRRVKLNPSSTQDFFASGEFLKKVGVDGNIVVVDLIDDITDEVFCVVPNYNPLVQKEKISNGAIVSVWNKGDVVNFPTAFNETTVFYAEVAEAVEAGDKVQVSADGNTIELVTTGAAIGTVVIGADAAGKTAQIVLTKI